MTKEGSSVESGGCLCADSTEHTRVINPSKDIIDLHPRSSVRPEMAAEWYILAQILFDGRDRLAHPSMSDA
jgi:hypothetical protein